MNTQQNNHWVTGAWLAIVLGAGLAARFWISTFGHNFDLESYRLVVGIVEQGKNVYANTDRYNYGPVWFNVLHVLDLLAAHNPAVFRWLLIGFLSAADVGISYVLWRRFGRLAATLFFLNPISIIITGFHNQFDNVAILTGLSAVLLFGDDFEKPVDRRKFCGLLVLGLSLMTKHVLFAFPLWLAVKQRGLLQKMVILAVPTAVFLAGFLPYWAGGHAGIVENVFHYHSMNTAHFYNFFMPAGTNYFLSAGEVWFVFLILFAFLCRPRNGFESLLLYTGVLVAASPATTNQYLAIPAALMSVFPSLLFLGYAALATFQLCADGNGLHLLKHWHGRYDDLAIYGLVCALLWLFWRRQIVLALQFFGQEINLQFARKK